MRLLSILPLLALPLLSVQYLAQAQSPAQIDSQIDSQAATQTATQTATPIIAELFTSQSCSSCPPAEALFSDLAERDDLITIEWHVDYWDNLVHHGSNWKDPYSDNSFTERQRSYNRSLRGKSAVYTPQAVVNGHLEGVGSRQGDVYGMLGNAPALSASVQISDNNTVTVTSTGEPADIVFVRLLKSHETAVKGGENKGRKLGGRNIALSATTLGQTRAQPIELDLPTLEDGESCAVLVQSRGEDLGPVIGAAKCG